MFKRRSMEAILTDMINWTRGVTNSLTDFRVGSKIRTLYEAVAYVLEKQSDRFFRYMRELIQENIYSVLGFAKLPAQYATGLVTFAKATAADQDYFIPSGTAVLSQATEFTAPLKFYTTEDAVLAIGTTSVDVTVICEVAGVRGNVTAGDINDFLQKPTGIDTVTNATAFTNGTEEETSDAQKLRFQEFVQANARGVLQSVEYGAKLATVADADGNITERVKLAKATEDLPARKGEVDLYVWNGVGVASSALIDDITKQLTGYYDAAGNAVYGYKPAGNMVNIYSAAQKVVNLKVTMDIEASAVLADVQSAVGQVIDTYFSLLALGSTLYQTELESRIENTDGVADVKLYLSSDGGTTYTEDNVTSLISEIIVAAKPITFS